MLSSFLRVCISHTCGNRKLSVLCAGKKIHVVPDTVTNVLEIIYAPGLFVFVER
jgi:hypothetical protein